jgi:hypothetical protein
MNDANLYFPVRPLEVVLELVQQLLRVARLVNVIQPNDMPRLPAVLDILSSHSTVDNIGLALILACEKTISTGKAWRTDEY